MEPETAKAKLFVLYPKPKDEQQFEKMYFAEHIPLMRKIIGSDGVLATYRVRRLSQAEPAFYRVAEIGFPDMDALRRFVLSDDAPDGSASATKTSTGGPPTVLLCESD